MPSRELPPRPHLDQLKRQAKELRSAFLRGEPDARARVLAAVGPVGELRLSDAQRVLAREHGFPTWARLRAHVEASRGIDEAVDALLRAVAEGDAARAAEIAAAEPGVASRLHAAAALGLDDQVRLLLAEDPSQVAARAGDPPGEPLLWLCYSPFHGERDRGLEAAARALLDAGADPSTRDGGRYGLPALYAVTGHREVPRIAQLLLDAGADPDDGESVHHAAERFHERALELLLAGGADLNRTGDWGNTPLYFLLRQWDVGPRRPRVEQGVRWLLAHGADPDVRCGREQETSLHVAARQGRRPEVVRLLLDHGADVHARRDDGRTAWELARRAGHEELVALLEEAGAAAGPLDAAGELVTAIGRGDAAAARRLASPALVAALDPAELRLLPEAAAAGRTGVVTAALAAGFPVDAPDEEGATALHHAAIRGDAATVRELLRHGARLELRDAEHRSTPLGWATFGADEVARPGGDYPGTARALVEAGARLGPEEHEPAHPGVLEVVRATRHP
jgi:ankyrin repeat protein